MIYTVSDFEIPLETIQGGVGDDLLNPPPRSDGWHLSEIIRDLMNRTVFKNKRQDFAKLRPEDQKQAVLRWEVGFIWEVIVENVYRQRMQARRSAHGVVRQSEMTVEGVHMTPDGWRVEDDVEEEYKATWKSSVKLDAFEEEFFEWLVQNRAYCRALRTNRSEFFILFVNGDYRGSGPQSKKVEVEYTQRELDENWQMILNHKALMEREGLRPRNGRR